MPDDTTGWGGNTDIAVMDPEWWSNIGDNVSDWFNWG
jgi:hypothetical protein